VVGARAVGCGRYAVRCGQGTYHRAWSGRMQSGVVGALSGAVGARTVERGRSMCSRMWSLCCQVRSGRILLSAIGRVPLGAVGAHAVRRVGAHAVVHILYLHAPALTCYCTCMHLRSHCWISCNLHILNSPFAFLSVVFDSNICTFPFNMVGKPEPFNTFTIFVTGRESLIMYYIVFIRLTEMEPLSPVDNADCSLEGAAACKYGWLPIPSTNTPTHEPAPLMCVNKRTFCTQSRSMSDLRSVTDEESRTNRFGFCLFKVTVYYWSYWSCCNYFKTKQYKRLRTILLSSDEGFWFSIKTLNFGI